ncbi:MAG: hypothetical protein Q8O61_01055, partial [Nocardioides sp.]|nr:hypothetical protein [Nocardioides sp.]
MDRRLVALGAALLLPLVATTALPAASAPPAAAVVEAPAQVSTPVAARQVPGQRQALVIRVLSNRADLIS